jgi:hypothetical protein
MKNQAFDKVNHLEHNPISSLLASGGAERQAL